ncbi:MAG: hypothetical protein MUF06_06275 [Pirellulaceae bacterium]|jgi:cellobiose phosphorylase|nr:hypothetical protein [Pirellulaceae bacterium]
MPLSNAAGPVLDPIVSIRQTVLLMPNESVRINVVTGVVKSRDRLAHCRKNADGRHKLNGRSN